MCRCCEGEEKREEVAPYGYVVIGDITGRGGGSVLKVTYPGIHLVGNKTSD